MVAGVRRPAWRVSGGLPGRAVGGRQDDHVAETPIAVFDVDGVVADVRHRLRHVVRRPKDWIAFFAAADRDPALADGVELVHRFAVDHRVVWLTGRPERLRAVTEQIGRAHV